MLFWAPNLHTQHLPACHSACQPLSFNSRPLQLHHCAAAGAAVRSGSLTGGGSGSGGVSVKAAPPLSAQLGKKGKCKGAGRLGGWPVGWLGGLNMRLLMWLGYSGGSGGLAAQCFEWYLPVLLDVPWAHSCEAGGGGGRVGGRGVA